MRNLLAQAPLAVRIDRVPVLLRNLQPSVAVDMRRLCGVAEKILAAAHVQDAELSIVLVSDRRIRALNARYRKKDRATDVLAFPLMTRGIAGARGARGARPPRLLGDVVISMATARRQAKTHGHSVHAEIVRLLIHGVMHLLGYDHEQGPREAARMAGQERRVLRIVEAM